MMQDQEGNMYEAVAAEVPRVADADMPADYYLNDLRLTLLQTLEGAKSRLCDTRDG